MQKTPPLGAALLLAALFLAPLGAQERKPPTQEELKQRLAEKLAEPWLRHVPWVLDYEEALAQATREGKPVFAYFTRSYAG